MGWYKVTLQLHPDMVIMHAYALDRSSAIRKWSSRLYVQVCLGPHPQTQILGCGVNQSYRERSLEEILSRHGLKPTDKECPERVRDEVAVKLDDWEMAGRLTSSSPWRN